MLLALLLWNYHNRSRWHYILEKLIVSLHVFFLGLSDAYSRYLEKHPEYMSEGVSLSRFSFQIPKPLQENYVRKRPAPARPALQNYAGDPGMQQYLPQSEGDRNSFHLSSMRLSLSDVDVLVPSTCLFIA